MSTTTDTQPQPTASLTRPTGATGWWNPEPWRTTSKWHWVTETGRTACGRYAYLRGDIERGLDESPDNCATCRKKRQKSNDKAERMKPEAFARAVGSDPIDKVPQ